ncbi:myosin-2 essential light chain [Eurytemora carolleeae]|uniref:myosin-2 essential light chain n=1 Tax=Eurytemora carolleeae TaxID=1294199 RepID=UPI000C76908E|nr:myosin-2 essential light chain [Eurytemora carolleeae]|eukprot:XP_023323070.1 myosin-2 essential light chain-like [Eurytemora affinis]
MPEKPGFTEDQVADYQECFFLFDTKGDGCILDKPDSRVTFEQFLPMLQAVSSKQITDTVDDFVEGLRHFDKEGNGRISAVELRHLLIGLGEKMTEEEVEVLIHGKEDAQGNINYEEFVKMVLAQ